MKRLNKIFKALLGVVTLLCVALIAVGSLVWRKISGWWKRRSTWVRRLLAFVFIVVPVGIVSLIAYSYYEYEYGRNYWRDKNLSENVALHAYRNYKYRAYNLTVGKYTTGRINWVSGVEEGDSLAVYAVPGKRGFINVNSGEIVIDAMANNYSKAWVFSEGLAAVMKDGKVGFVNARNEVVIPFEFDYPAEECASNPSYLFHNGYCAMSDKNGKWGIINKDGKWILTPSYDAIWAPQDRGCRVVVAGEKYGALDSLYNVVYPAEYDFVNILSDGYVLDGGGKKWKEDCNGNIVQPFMYDATYYLKFPIGYNDCGEIEYAFADYLKYEIGNCYGIMNRFTGEPITLALYSDINMLSNELFEVCDAESCDWFLLDSNGNVVSKK
ncbi:MAG: WG repeat-containing protein [Bacteroidaceae bacterium]|nr:WG repeat-containing protein [Bacteroidaceae bacterium]